MNPFLFSALAAAAWLAATAPVALAQPAAAATGRRMTLDQAVRFALDRSPDLDISEKGVDSARARLKVSRSRRLPTLSVESQALYWNEELAFGLAAPGMEPPPGGEGQVVVREQVTTSTSLTATQLLSHQIVIGRLVAADRAGVQAAELDHSARRLQVASGVATAYLGVLLADENRSITEARVGLVSAQLDRARILEESGSLGKVDVMRLEASLAAARREAIVAASQAESARDSLVLQLGLPVGSRIEPVDALPPVSAPPVDPDQAVRRALGARPDLKAAQARARQARAGALVQRADLLPSLVAFGTYQYNTGGGEFQPESAWFVGLGLNWNIWDWGATLNTYRAARHQADQAAMAAERQEDGARAEVRRAAREVQAAHQALAVAEVGLAAAEEAFRIQEVRFAEGATTTTDLLAANLEVTQARTGFASARFAYYTRLAQLAQATGQLPDALLSAPRTTGSP
jgi:outer membrane protein TolC